MFRIIFLVFGCSMALPGNAKIESMLQSPIQYKVFVLESIFHSNSILSLKSCVHLVKRMQHFISDPLALSKTKFNLSEREKKTMVLNGSLNTMKLTDGLKIILTRTQSTK